jgi:L-ascorbate metabolism protein UlaG (beta-lactamase superfamily)
LTLSSGSVFFIGTATTLITYGGFSILTDPNFLHSGDHVHLGYGLFSKRITNPAVEIEDLPHLDLCVLSHMHGDHWDRVAKEKLPKELPIVTTPAAANTLKKQGFESRYPLQTWEAVTFIKGSIRLHITSMPGRHGPGMVNALLPPVMGTMLDWEQDGRTCFRLYISGDTLIHDQLAEIPRRYPDINLALLHLGGTKIIGMLVTMDARQGIQAIRILKPEEAIPIHYNDYTVFKSPLEDFVKEVEKAGVNTKMHYLQHGDTFEFEVRNSPAVE